MGRTSALLLCVGLLVGCEQSEQERLVGRWGLPLGQGCALGLTFDHDGKWRESRTCRTAAGDIQVEAREGTYAATQSELTATLELSSCPDDVAVTRHASYVIEGSSLQLGEDFEPFYLRLAPDADAADAGLEPVVLGCFDGVIFREQPLAPVEL